MPTRPTSLLMLADDLPCNSSASFPYIHGAGKDAALAVIHDVSSDCWVASLCPACESKILCLAGLTSDHGHGDCASLHVGGDASCAECSDAASAMNAAAMLGWLTARRAASVADGTD